MSFGILSPARQFISKPFGGNFYVDRDHPLAKGLLLAIPLGEPGNRALEYIERIYSTAMVTTTSPLIQNGSRYFTDSTSASNCITFVPRASWISLGTGPYTVLSRVYHIAHNAYTSPVFALNTYSPNWMTNPTGRSPVGSLEIYAGSGYIPTHGATGVAINKWNNLGWIRNSTASLDTWLYLNGVNDANVTHSQNIAAATSMRIGENGPSAPGGYHHYGYIDFVYLWNRALSHAEVNDFFVNPNQIYLNNRKLFSVAGVLFSGLSISGNVQAQPATTTSAVEILTSISGTVQAQPATVTASIIITDISSISGSVQAQSATTTATIQSLASISGNVQAQPATVTGTITSVDSINISGSVQAQPATALQLRLLCIGQSNMAGWDTASPLLSSVYKTTLMWKNSTARWQEIVAPDCTSSNPGSGSSIMHALLDKLYELTGKTAGSLNTAYGGIGVVEGNSGQIGWYSTGSTPYSQMVTKVNATGKAFDVILHWGAESDSLRGITKTAFKAAFLIMFENLKTTLENPLIYLFCVKQNYPSGSTNSQIREAFDELAAENNRIVLFDDAANYTRIDDAHVRRDDMPTIGVNGAQSIFDNIIAQTENKIVGSAQAQPATVTGTVESIASVSGSVQAQPATITASIIITNTSSIIGNVQAQPATTTGAVEVIAAVSGAVQAQPATCTCTITTSNAIFIYGNVQAQPATCTCTITTSNASFIYGNVQAEPATSAATIQSIASISGNAQAQPATVTGTINTLLSISGDVQAQPATSAADITAIASISGDVQAQDATATGDIATVSYDDYYVLTEEYLIAAEGVIDRDVNETDMIRFNGRDFEILTIEDVQERNFEKWISCKERRV